MFQSRSERKFLLHCLEELSSFMPPCVHAKIAPTNLKCLPPAAAITNLQLGRKDVNIRLKDSEVAVGPITEYSYDHLAEPQSFLFLHFQIQRQCICVLTVLQVARYHCRPRNHIPGKHMRKQARSFPHIPLFAWPTIKAFQVGTSLVDIPSNLFFFSFWRWLRADISFSFFCFFFFFFFILVFYRSY